MIVDVKPFVGVLTIATTVAAGLLRSRDCAPNNCLRAIQNSGLTGLSDCASYLHPTVASTPQIPSQPYNPSNSRHQSLLQNTGSSQSLQFQTEILSKYIPTNCPNPAAYSAACSCLSTTPPQSGTVLLAPTASEHSPPPPPPHATSTTALANVHLQILTQDLDSRWNNAYLSAFALSNEKEEEYIGLRLLPSNQQTQPGKFNFDQSWRLHYDEYLITSSSSRRLHLSNDTSDSYSPASTSSDPSYSEEEEEEEEEKIHPLACTIADSWMYCYWNDAYPFVLNEDSGELYIGRYDRRGRILGGEEVRIRVVS